MKIYTKTGDKGYTSLFGGKRVLKSDDRVEAYGTSDELNSFIGLLRDHIDDKSYRDILLKIQNEIFVIGSYLATPPDEKSEKKLKIDALGEENIQFLEERIDEMNKDLPVMTHFILPGGHPLVSYCHVCRNICRKTERNVVKLSEITTIDPIIITYLNRLSDYFFVLARKLAKENNVEEIKWNASIRNH